MKDRGSNKTRKIKNKPSSPIEHHHLLVRAELAVTPTESQQEEVKQLVQNLITDIGMSSLSDVKTFFVNKPEYNKGLSAIGPIQTSHVALHFWTKPDPVILHTKRASGLLQMDIYTCGSLDKRKINTVLRSLERWKCQHIDITLLNRRKVLYVQRHSIWDCEDSKRKFLNWVDTEFNPY